MRPALIVFLTTLLLAGQALGKTYEVKKGDSLYKIARTFGITIVELRHANSLSGITLSVGQVLEIPERTVRREGEAKKGKEPADDTLTVRETARILPPAGEFPQTEVRSDGDTTMVILKGLLPPEGERAGYLLVGDTLKVLKRQLKAPRDTAGAVFGRPPIPLFYRSVPAQEIADYALTLLGTPYHYGGTTEQGGFDCSGFVRHVFSNFKIDLPHSSREQYSLGRAVFKGDLVIGDLLFFTSPGRSKGVGHVGIYIGDGQFIHASSGKKKKIIISALDSTYYAKRYVGARRLSL
jgi:LysM repeat protein